MELWNRKQGSRINNKRAGQFTEGTEKRSFSTTQAEPTHSRTNAQEESACSARNDSKWMSGEQEDAHGTEKIGNDGQDD